MADRRRANQLEFPLSSQALLKKNARVYMASRNKQKAEQAIADLKADTGKGALFLELDLASLQSVKRAAEVFVRFGRSTVALVIVR